MKLTESRLREIIKEELKDYKIPYSIGFKKRKDFKHGLVKQMFTLALIIVFTRLSAPLIFLLFIFLIFYSN